MNLRVASYLTGSKGEGKRCPQRPLQHGGTHWRLKTRTLIVMQPLVFAYRAHLVILT